MVSLKLVLLGLLIIIHFWPSHCVPRPPYPEKSLDNTYDVADRKYFNLTSSFSHRHRDCVETKDLVITKTKKAIPSVWSSFMDEFVPQTKRWFSEDGLRDWKNVFFEDPKHKAVYFGVWIFVCWVILITTCSFIFGLIFGIISINISYRVLHIFINDKNRLRIKRTFINVELLRRRRQDYIIRMSRARIKPPERKYELIELLYDESDTDRGVPPELEEPMHEKVIIRKYNIDRSSTSTSEYERDGGLVDLSSDEPEPEVPPEIARRRKAILDMIAKEEKMLEERAKYPSTYKRYYKYMYI